MDAGSYARACREPCSSPLFVGRFAHLDDPFPRRSLKVALAKLWSATHPHSVFPTHVVLPRGAHPVVSRFLAFHKHLLPIRGFKARRRPGVAWRGVA